MTSIEVAITNANLEVLASIKSQASAPRSPDVLVETINSLVAALRSKHALDPARAVGVAIPSPVSFIDGVPVNPPLMAEWNGYPLRDRLSELFACCAVVDNDVNAMALGEMWGGVAKGVSDFVYVKLGTGIGSALVLDGHVYRGVDGCAGDIGHIQVAEQPSCWCGKQGCLEAVFGGAAIARDAMDLAVNGQSPVLARLLDDQRALSALSVVIAAGQGDTAALDLIRVGGDMVGRVLAGVVNVVNPGMIVIGGGLSQLGDVLLAGVRQRIYQSSLPLATRNLPIVTSGMGDLAGAIGAAYIASSAFFDRR